MKQRIMLFAPLLAVFLVGCNKSTIDMPKSPFNDSYKRIGMTSEYTGAIESIDRDEYNLLKTETSYDVYKAKPKGVTNYKTTTETRDLKYAYFGKESGSVSMCVMNTDSSDATRYSDLKTVIKDTSNTQKQTTKGVINTSSLAETYTWDTGSKDTQKKYKITARKKYNDEKAVDSLIQSETEYDGNDQPTKEQVFSLKPYEKLIANHFRDGFKFFGDDAVYGKIKVNNVDRYIIKEAYSIFGEHQTAIGRKYKCCDNSFYEALLEKHDNSVRFTNFRFYKERLILSEAIDDTGIPVLYLAKPVLVDYSEAKYSIGYNEVGSYTGGDIPNP